MWWMRECVNVDCFSKRMKELWVAFHETSYRMWDEWCVEDEIQDVWSEVYEWPQCIEYLSRRKRKEEKLQMSSKTKWYHIENKPLHTAGHVCVSVFPPPSQRHLPCAFHRRQSKLSKLTNAFHILGAASVDFAILPDGLEGMDGPVFGCGWYDVIVGIEDEDRPVCVCSLVFDVCMSLGYYLGDRFVASCVVLCCVSCGLKEVTWILRSWVRLVIF